MSTNAETASKWLYENGAISSDEKLNKIYKNIEHKLKKMDQFHADYEGLLDALNIIESYIIERKNKRTIHHKNIEQKLDYSPLVDYNVKKYIQIAHSEKHKRFQKLLLNLKHKKNLF